MSRIARLAVPLLCLFLSLPVHGETTNCTPIPSLPFYIYSPGTYCLTGSLFTNQTTSSGISIYTSNVNLDLNGWTIDGSGAGAATTARGITATSATYNVTVANGTVRGFYIGVRLDGAASVVSNMLLDSNTGTGILLFGPNNVAEGNHVFRTGGAANSENAYTYGIWAYGENEKVLGNTISGLLGGAQSFGIQMTKNTGIVRGNDIMNLTKPTTPPYSYGIQSGGGIIANNTINNFSYGISSTGLYAQNVVYNCMTAYASTGTKGAGNSP
jgi:hypothetical protein